MGDWRSLDVMRGEDGCGVAARGCAVEQGNDEEEDEKKEAVLGLGGWRACLVMAVLPQPLPH